MDNSDLTASIQEMMAEMATMRAELNSLKERAQALPHPVQLATNPKPITSTRRTTLKLECYQESRPQTYLHRVE
jgi:uncharacterized protein YfcZ (UPF0381/DUF406 family)